MTDRDKENFWEWYRFSEERGRRQIEWARRMYGPDMFKHGRIYVNSFITCFRIWSAQYKPIKNKTA